MLSKNHFSSSSTGCFMCTSGTSSPRGPCYSGPANKESLLRSNPNKCLVFLMILEANCKLSGTACKVTGKTPVSGTIPDLRHVGLISPFTQHGPRRWCLTWQKAQRGKLCIQITTPLLQGKSKIQHVKLEISLDKHKVFTYT